MKRHVKILLLVLAVLAAASVFLSCEADETDNYQTLDEINGQTVGVLPGSIGEEYTGIVWPDSEQVSFTDAVDMALALKQGLIEAYIDEEPIVRYMCTQTDELTYIDENIADVDYSFAFAKNDEGDAMCAKMNAFLSELASDGTLAKIEDQWFNDTDSDYKIDTTGITGENGYIVFASAFSTAPFAYLDRMEYVGYEMDIIVRFCTEYGYGYSVLNLGAADAISAVQTGLADIAGGCLTITEERAENVNFCDPIYRGGMVAAIKNYDAAEPGFFDSLSLKFSALYGVDDNNQLMIKGLVNTLAISGISCGIGFALGFLMFVTGRRRGSAGRKFCRGYSVVLGYLPILIVLLILFYIVFSQFSDMGFVVAVIAFTMYFAAEVSTVSLACYDGLDEREMKAAYALGFSEKLAFWKYAVPNVLYDGINDYKNAIVSVVQGTSIVGYISVVDITNASEILASKTYETIIPLLITAAIYFAITFVITAVLKKITIKHNPFARSRSIIMRSFEKK